ncbi:hypothetical protein ABMA27_009289 [Loxostege sticticalis]|uniref:Uncharacterized protein n=1 Tax=Loxostege sticticalis TaxID=481309 RepID=A0ABR3H7G4_LOXSC
MKSVLSFLGIVGSISLYLSLGGGARGQLFENPLYTFQNITFDQVNRGSYNSSDCLFDLLNCWEAVRTDMICFRNWRWMTTVCNIMRDYCAESYGDQDSFNEIFNIREGLCYSSGKQSWT